MGNKVGGIKGQGGQEMRTLFEVEDALLDNRINGGGRRGSENSRGVEKEGLGNGARDKGSRFTEKY